MTHDVEVRVRFRAGHRLIPPYEGHCNNVHGEGYTAICIFSSDELDENGMVADFGQVKRDIKKWIDEHWDHTYIHHKDDKVGPLLKDMGMKTFSIVSNPTAEHMAEFLFKVLTRHIEGVGVKKVGIIESFEDSIAWYQE